MLEAFDQSAPSDGDIRRQADILADRLLRGLPSHGTTHDTLQQALLERALIYAAEVEQQLASVEQRIAQLQDLSATDELTGLLNRRGFMEQFNRALALAKRYGHRGVLIFCDVDNFKAVNDTLGHSAGDELLREIARVLAATVRQADIVGRLGGDEFAVALVQTSPGDGTKRLQTLRWHLETSLAHLLPNGPCKSVSLGLEPFGPKDDADEILSRADMAMYYEKGRKITPPACVAAE